MKVTLINQYYPPDNAPTGRYLHDLARALLVRGHEVTVLCSQRAYNGSHSFPAHEELDGVHIRRVWASGFGRMSAAGKLLDYGTFYVSLLLNLLKGGAKPDVILALTTPPYVGLLARWAAKWKRAAHAHWVMDLYPDVLAAHGAMSERGVPFRILAGLTRRELRQSPLIVTLGDDMAVRLRRRVRDDEGIRSCVEPLPLWSDPALFPWEGAAPPFRAEQGWGERDMILMYSGNMGRGHRFGEFLAAATALKQDRSVHWSFAGGGKRRVEIESARSRDPHLNLSLLPFAPVERLREQLCSADVHLASLEKEWEGCMVPSKVQGIFAVGKPLIFVGGENNSIAQWLREAGAGWVVPENDVAALLAAVEAARDPAERERRGRAARLFAESHFDRERNLGQLCRWIETRCARGARKTIAENA